jgi:hypothetical protein
MAAYDYRPNLPSSIHRGTSPGGEDGPDIRRLPDENSTDEIDGLPEVSKQAQAAAREQIAAYNRRIKERDESLADNEAERAGWYKTAFENGLDRQGRTQEGK